MTPELLVELRRMADQAVARNVHRIAPGLATDTEVQAMTEAMKRIKDWTAEDLEKVLEYGAVVRVAEDFRQWRKVIARERRLPREIG